MSKNIESFLRIRRNSLNEIRLPEKLFFKQVFTTESNEELFNSIFPQCSGSKVLQHTLIVSLGHTFTMVGTDPALKPQYFSDSRILGVVGLAYQRMVSELEKLGLAVECNLSMVMFLKDEPLDILSRKRLTMVENLEGFWVFKGVSNRPVEGEEALSRLLIQKLADRKESFYLELRFKGKERQKLGLVTQNITLSFLNFPLSCEEDVYLTYTREHHNPGRTGKLLLTSLARSKACRFILNLDSKELESEDTASLCRRFSAMIEEKKARENSDQTQKAIDIKAQVQQVQDAGKVFDSFAQTFITQVSELLQVSPNDDFESGKFLKVASRFQAKKEAYSQFLEESRKLIEFPNQMRADTISEKKTCDLLQTELKSQDKSLLSQEEELFKQKKLLESETLQLEQQKTRHATSLAAISKEVNKTESDRGKFTVLTSKVEEMKKALNISSKASKKDSTPLASQESRLETYRRRREEELAKFELEVAKHYETKSAWNEELKRKEEEQQKHYLTCKNRSKHLSKETRTLAEKAKTLVQSFFASWDESKPLTRPLDLSHIERLNESITPASIDTKIFASKLEKSELVRQAIQDQKEKIIAKILEKRAALKELKAQKTKDFLKDKENAKNDISDVLKNMLKTEKRKQSSLRYSIGRLLVSQPHES